MPQRIRFYELAHQLGAKPKVLHAKVRSLGFAIRSYMSTVTPQQAEQITAALRGGSAPATEAPAAPRRSPAPVIRREGTARIATPEPATKTTARVATAEPAAKTTARVAMAEPATETNVKSTEATASSAPIERDTETTATEAGGRRVVRDERGVIVGAVRRSEPKILGYIKVPPRPRKLVKVAKAEPRKETGRATRRKQREERKRLARRRSAAHERARRRKRRERASHTVPRRPENRVLEIEGSVLVSDLAHAMSKTASEVLHAGYDRGLRRLRVEDRVDVETARTLAGAFSWRIEDTSFDEAALLQRVSEAEPEPRAPVVTVMGHVDHGKTSLLDSIRSTRVAKREAGGITQHIGAYRVDLDSGSIVFLDTPGHEAFNAMRARGAQVTDIVVLVVAADDGVMPTTIEAIEHAREADVPVVVALTKVDLPAANPGRVKQQLMEHRIIGEEFGGDTLICEVSAVSGEGIDGLLEALLLQAEVMELRAPVGGRARGIVLESRVRKGHGPTCTVLVQVGTLRPGDVMVAGNTWGKVRRLLDASLRPVKEAGPSTPVTVVGLDSPPSTGRPAVIVDDADAAKRIIAHREERQRRSMRPRNVLSIDEFRRRRSLHTLPLLVKTDVAGSAEAVAEVLDSLEVEGVQLELIGEGLGPVTEGDVKTAAASEATIVAFAVKTEARGEAAARQHGVELIGSRVIYELADAVLERMQGLVEPVYEERELGVAEVRALFQIPRVGRVAGARVLDGEITRGARVRVVRDGETIHEGSLASLRIHKDDVGRVGSGHECGLVVAGFSELREGDRIEAFDLRQAVGS